MKSLFPIAVIGALIVLIGWILGDSEQIDNRPKTRGGDFTLQSVNGAVSLHDFKDKVVLLYFGYTWCPDICPTNLSLMAAAFSDLAPELRKQSQGIFISVDPDRDSPERLDEYARFFHENIIGVTGTAEQIAELAGRYGVGYRLVKQDSATDYVVDHTSETYVIDGRGEWVETLSHAASVEKIVESITAHLPPQERTSE